MFQKNYVNIKDLNFNIKWGGESSIKFMNTKTTIKQVKKGFCECYNLNANFFKCVITSN